MTLLLKLIGGLIFLLFLFFVFLASKRHQEQQLLLTELINQMMIDNGKINSTKPMMEFISVDPVPVSIAKVEIDGMVVSTNGRCGLSHATRCPGKQCCSNSDWCAGTQGTNSAWCFKDGKGQSLGKYDGRS